MQPAEQVAALDRAGAPPAVMALARLFEAMDKPTRMEGATQSLMQVYDKASLYSLNDWPLLPELQALKDLDKRLPSQLRLAQPLPVRSVIATGSPGREAPPEAADDYVVRVLEAITPWIPVPASFEQAMVQADDPGKWAETAPQIEIIGKAERLRADGALARWRLKKKTRLLQPLVAGFTTQETIDISVEGRDDDDKKSGVRRYSHVLVSSSRGPGLVKLRDDTGSIELSGDQNGCLVCIRKRIVAEVPRTLNDEFGGLLSDGLLALLWFWATAFAAAAAPVSRELKSGASGRAPKIEAKKIESRKNGVVEVAVLGGGPAGLACAWLLSNPAYKNGRAWSPPRDKPLEVKVKLVEKEFRLGGKAASGRRRDGEQFRVEEHGLHVLMGFYKNTLEILSTLGALDSLQDINTTLLPPTDGGSLDESWKLSLAPWEKVATPGRSLLDWVKNLDAVATHEWKGLGLSGVAQVLDGGAAHDALANDQTSAAFLVLGRAKPSPRPLLRTFVRAWELVASLEPAASKRANAQWLDNITTQVMIRRVAVAEMGHAAQAERDPMSEALRGLVAQPPEEALGPLAKILRDHARSALQGKEPEVELAREVLELSTTIAIGLDSAGLIPTWSLADPGTLVEDGPRYRDWVRQVQERLDGVSLSVWLSNNDIEEDFPKRSRILAAITAGLFTTPDDIAAGTFINGLARFLLTYDDAPYKRMLGGTGEAVIGPIFESLRAKPDVVTVSTGTEVEGMDFAEGLARTAKLSTKGEEDQALFKQWLNGRRFGWPAPAVGSTFDPAKPSVLEADAFVLAIPPFQKTLLGLPPALADKLGKIESCATVGVQCWTTGQGLFPKAIISGLNTEFRCAAAMDHLQDEEGPGVAFAPVYYCGDIDDTKAKAWDLNQDPIDQWLKDNFPRFQKGTIARKSLKVVNHKLSNRYVSANVKTQAARLYPFETGVPNLWLAGDWTRTALSCGSLEAAVTSGLEAARDILVTLGCKVDFPIVGDCFERTTN